MARQPRDGHPLSFTVDVMAPEIRVSGDGSAATEAARSGSGNASGGSSPEEAADAPRPTAAPPTFLGMAASLVGSMAKFAASGCKTVDEESHRLRMSRCGPCQYRRHNRCILCGCFIVPKAWLPHEDCPIGHWPL
jgi:hypothetical protein